MCLRDKVSINPVRSSPSFISYDAAATDWIPTKLMSEGNQAWSLMSKDPRVKTWRTFDPPSRLISSEASDPSIGSSTSTWNAQHKRECPQNENILPQFLSHIKPFLFPVDVNGQKTSLLHRNIRDRLLRTARICPDAVSATINMNARIKSIMSWK